MRGFHTGFVSKWPTEVRASGSRRACPATPLVVKSSYAHSCAGFMPPLPCASHRCSAHLCSPPAPRTGDARDEVDVRSEIKAARREVLLADEQAYKVELAQHTRAEELGQSPGRFVSARSAVSLPRVSPDQVLDFVQNELVKDCADDEERKALQTEFYTRLGEVSKVGFKLDPELESELDEKIPRVLVPSASDKPLTEAERQFYINSGKPDPAAALYVPVSDGKLAAAVMAEYGWDFTQA